MPIRRVITILLLAWAIGLGFIQAGVQPVYDLQAEKVPVCTSGCAEESGLLPENCLVVCMVWCAMPAFSAVSETDEPVCAPAASARDMGFEDFEGQIRHPRPLLPPPRV